MNHCLGIKLAQPAVGTVASPPRVCSYGCFSGCAAVAVGIETDIVPVQVAAPQKGQAGI